LCERICAKQRHRSKVLLRFKCVKECLKLLFAMQCRTNGRWPKVKTTRLEHEDPERYIRAYAPTAPRSETSSR